MNHPLKDNSVRPGVPIAVVSVLAGISGPLGEKMPACAEEFKP